MRGRARWIVLVAGVLALAAGGLLLARLPGSEGRSGGRLPEAWTLWPVAALGPELAGGRFSADHLAAGPEVVVAVGRGEGGRPGAWYSTDGVTWRPGDLAGLAGGPRWGAEISGLVRYGGGFLAAGVTTVGEMTPVFGETIAWRSADGRSWTRVDGPPAPDGSVVGHPWLHIDGDRAAVVVSEREIAVLGPQDTTWQRVELELGDCRLNRRVDLGGTPSLAGADCPGGGTDEGRAMVRLDGSSGSRPVLRVPAGETGATVAVGDGTAVALVRHVVPEPGAGGTEGTGGVGTASGTASGTATLEPMDGGGGDDGGEGGGEGGEGAAGGRTEVRISRSGDGGAHWTDAAPPPLPEGAETGSGSPMYVQWTGHGYVATGWAQDRLGSVPLVWVSADGVKWSVQRIARFADEGSLGAPVAFRGMHLVPAVYPGGTAGLLISGGPPLRAEVTGSRTAAGPSTGAPVAGTPATRTPTAGPPTIQRPSVGPPETGSPAPDSTGPSLTQRMAGTWGGTVAGGSSATGGTVRLGMRAVETASGPRLLVGKLTMDNCSADVVQQQRPADGTVPLTVENAKAEVAGTVFGSASCPSRIELRLTADGRLSWVDDLTRQGVLESMPPD
ncbi:hypothetical protein [Kitasatospora sp. NPDC004289]